MKLIIENRSDLDIETVFILVRKVIEEGRVSNDGKQYCYVTSFVVGEDAKRFMVSTDVNKKSDRFVISEYIG